MRERQSRYESNIEGCLSRLMASVGVMRTCPVIALAAFCNAFQFFFFLYSSCQHLSGILCIAMYCIRIDCICQVDAITRMYLYCLCTFSWSVVYVVGEGEASIVIDAYEFLSWDCVLHVLRHSLAISNALYFFFASRSEE